MLLLKFAGNKHKTYGFCRIEMQRLSLNMQITVFIFSQIELLECTILISGFDILFWKQKFVSHILT